VLIKNRYNVLTNTVEKSRYFIYTFLDFRIAQKAKPFGYVLIRTISGLQRFALNFNRLQY